MSLRGDVTLASDRIAVEGLRAEIDRRPLTGRLAYLFRSGTRPARLDAEIKAPQFDIDAAVAFGEGPARRLGDGAAWRNKPARPISNAPHSPALKHATRGCGSGLMQAACSSTDCRSVILPARVSPQAGASRPTGTHRAERFPSISRQNKQPQFSPRLGNSRRKARSVS